MASPGKVEVFKPVTAGVIKFGEVTLGGMAEKSAVRDKALCGDMVITVTPANPTPAPVSEAWSQPVTVKLLTDAGELHDWCNMTLASKASVADDSSAGTASLASGNVVFVNGVATLTLNGSAHSWLNGEVVTVTVNLTDDILGYTVASVEATVTFTTPPE